MRHRHSSLFLLLALAGCTAAERPFAPVSDVRYSAIGSDPFWTLSIGDDRMVLTRGPDGAGSGLRSVAFPRVLPQSEGGARRWEYAGEQGVITIVSRAGPCEVKGGRSFEDRVTVSLSGVQLVGCGGRQVRGQ